MLSAPSSGARCCLAARASAAMGESDAALDHLGKAIDRGWSDIEVTEACIEFGPLHGTARWLALLDRMGE